VYVAGSRMIIWRLIWKAFAVIWFTVNLGATAVNVGLTVVFVAAMGLSS